jgi:hypothetical protein
MPSGSAFVSLDGIGNVRLAAGDRAVALKAYEERVAAGLRPCGRNYG